MKQTITIRQHGDTVYFLNSDGFQKGTVKRTVVVSQNREPLGIKYYVIAKDDNAEFMGAEKEPNEVFDSKQEMFDYYKNSLK